MRSIRAGRLLSVIIGGVIGILLLTVGVLTWKYSSLKHHAAVTAQNNAQDDKAKSVAIIGQVSAIYELPTDESPTVAQVKDKQLLTNQPFFAKAENGDYILVYSKNKLALLYREKDKKLINVGAITGDTTANGSTTPQVAPATTNTPSPKH